VDQLCSNETPPFPLCGWRPHEIGANRLGSYDQQGFVAARHPLRDPHPNALNPPIPNWPRAGSSGVLAGSTLQVPAFLGAGLTEFGAQRGIGKHELEDLLLSPAPFDPQIPPSPEARVRCLYDLARLAWADGVIQPEEQVLLCRLTELFGYESEVSERVSEVLLERAQAEVSPAAVIGEVVGMAGPRGPRRTIPASYPHTN
jgi:hypothetical protein